MYPWNGKLCTFHRRDELVNQCLQVLNSLVMKIKLIVQLTCSTVGSYLTAVIPRAPFSHPLIYCFLYYDTCLYEISEKPVQNYSHLVFDQRFWDQRSKNFIFEIFAIGFKKCLYGLYGLLQIYFPSYEWEKMSGIQFGICSHKFSIMIYQFVSVDEVAVV